ncbi:unnamed protein product [Brassicogethes aeneus]|uniref:Uncharacterized protein n=1 Tax=Brassicogethes aeneus TaxID=1431903 RepID=A0A9P0FE41_BRAAE|nr:unnamed protein product [Brassicogethes aeneus]
MEKNEKFCMYFHGFAVAHHINAILYTTFGHLTHNIHEVTDERVLDLKRFENKYFTGWNLGLQFLYFTLAFTLDLMKHWKLHPNKKLVKFKGYMFTNLVFPCSAFVCCMFWTVYTINREYVFPEIFDHYIPAWFNHSVHTNILIFILLEIFMVNHYMASFKSAFYSLLGLSLLYNIVFFHNYFEHGKWLYILFNIFSWTEIILFVNFNFLACLVFQRVGYFIQKYKFRWSKKKIITKYEQYKKDLLIKN